LQKIGIRTVRDIYNNRQNVINHMGNHGQQIVELADGIDDRVVAAATKSHSFGKEYTFQEDITDFEYLKHELRLIARELSFEIRNKGTFCRTVTLKVTYRDMKKITRAKSSDPINRADDIYKTAADLLDKIEKRPVRLVGITLSGFTDTVTKQISLFEVDTNEKENKLDTVILDIQRRFGLDKVKTGSEYVSEKRIYPDKKDEDET